MTRPRWRPLAEIGAFVVVLVAITFALDALARWQLRDFLLKSATSTVRALTRGDTPYRWSLANPRDLIAGRAFGTELIRLDDNGVRVTAMSQPVEIGFVLLGTIDLERYALLELHVDAEVPAQVSLSLRESLAEPLCRSSPTPITAGATDLRLDVVELAWTCDDQSVVAPKRAAMLRVQIELARGSSATLSNVRLLPIAAMTRNEFASARPVTLQWSPDVDAIDMQWSDALATLPADAWPLFQLPLRGRVEQALQVIDRVRARLPAAVIVAAGDWPELARRAAFAGEPAERSTRTGLDGLLVGAYVLALVGIRLRPLNSPRLQAALELAGVTAVPLVLVAGGHIGNDLDAPTLAAIGATLAFAASLLIGAAPREPATRTGQRGWAVAMATVAVSVLMAVWLREPGAAWAWPSSTRLLQYLAWAGVQQFLICVIVAARFERIFGSALWALPAAACVFALLHTPNAMLMQLTFVGGLIWVWNWQRHRALLANILSHVASGLLLATQLPSDWLRSAEVSARYFLF